MKAIYYVLSLFFLVAGIMWCFNFAVLSGGALSMVNCILDFTNALVWYLISREDRWVENEADS